MSSPIGNGIGNAFLILTVLHVSLRSGLGGERRFRIYDGETVTSLQKTYLYDILDYKTHGKGDKRVYSAKPLYIKPVQRERPDYD